MSPFKNDRALVIGIDDYQNGIPPLRTAVNDASCLGEILEQHHGYSVDLLINAEASADAILKHLAQLRDELTTDDRLLFYFAGHGVALDSDEGPRGHLVPQDADARNASSYLQMYKVHEALNALQCRHLLVILDSCFSGTFRWSATRDFGAFGGRMYKERYDRFVRDPAWQVITSASFDQTASDEAFNDDRGQVGNHSPFAHALLEALSTQNADRYGSEDGGDGVLTAHELYLHLEQAVQSSSIDVGRRQTPELWPLDKHGKGQFVFTVGNPELPKAPDLDADANPYRGLKSYEKENATMSFGKDKKEVKMFFGRDEEIEQLYESVSNRPLTAVLGVSGTGKSSVVKAGLLPRLDEDKGNWHVLPVVRPGATPLRNLFSILQAGSKLGAVNAGDVSKAIEKQQADHPTEQLVLVIDQFEELFTMTRDEAERCAVLELLASLAQSDKVRVVVTMRTDFEAQLKGDGAFEGLEEAWKEGRYVIPPMTRQNLQQVVEGPANALVVHFESEDLVARLVDDVMATPGGLPLLSFTLSEMYQRLHSRFLAESNVDRSLTWADYNALDGVIGSLRKRAEEEYMALDQQKRASMRRVMLRMVSSRAGQVVKQRVQRSDLVYEDIVESERANDVIDRLTEARLLVAGEENGERYVEPAHDALVIAWSDLANWIREANEQGVGLDFRQKLAKAAREWAQTERKEAKKGLLWNDAVRGTILSQLVKNSTEWMNLRERSFSRACLRSVKQRRTMLALTVLALTVIITGGLVAYPLVKRTIKNEKLVVSIAQANSAATASSPEDAALFAAQALQTDPAGIAHQRALLMGVGRYNNLIATLTTSGIGVTQVVFSPDGSKLASNSEFSSPGTSYSALKEFAAVVLPTAPGDNAIGIWDLHIGGPAKFLSSPNSNVTSLNSSVTSHDSNVTSVAFSPDGRKIASASYDHTVKLWDAESGEEIGLIGSHASYVNSVAFSPDGKKIVSASEDGSVRVWDVPLQDGKMESEKRKASRSEVEFTELTGPSDHPVNSVMFSPDGTIIASGSTSEGTIRMWSTVTYQEIRALEGFLSVERGGIAFSADGKRIAAPADNSIRVWHAHTGEKIAELLGHMATVTGVAFSPTGDTLVSASTDRTVRIWDVGLAKEIHDPIEHMLPVRSVAFSHRGNTLASASASKYGSGSLSTIRLWSLKQKNVLKGHTHGVNQVVFSPDSVTVASASSDSTVRLWDLKSGNLNQTLKHPARVLQLAFQTDHKMVVSASNDTIYYWDIADSRIDSIHSLAKLGGVALGLNGSIAYANRTEIHVRGFEGATVGNKKYHLKDGNVTHLGFSSTGDVLGVVFDSGTIDVLNTVDLLRVFDYEVESLPGSVSSMAISPDGDSLFYGTNSGDIGHREADSYRRQSFDRGHVSEIQDLVLSPNGKTLASASSDGTIRLWNVELGQEIATLSGHAGEVTSVAFSPDGAWLASSSKDGTVRLWDMRWEVLTEKACAIAVRNMSLQEWRSYGTKEYECACSQHSLGDGFSKPFFLLSLDGPLLKRNYKNCENPRADLDEFE